MQGIIGKQSHKEVEWRQRLARFAECGQQIKPFCQAESVSEGTFYRWRKLLAESGGAAPATSFIDAGLLPRSPAAQAIELASAALEVRLDLGHGLVLHIVRR